MKSTTIRWVAVVACLVAIQVYLGRPSKGKFDEVVATQFGASPGTGTWIGGRKILTASHVTDGLSKGTIYARSGARRVVRVQRRHPKLDLALLCIEGIDLQGEAASISEDAPKVDSKVTVAGWGDGSSFENPTIGQSKVEELRSESILAGPDPQVACEGDSGGPAYVKGGKAIVGVFLDNEPSTAVCGDKPDAVYARVDVAPVRAWIKEVACP